MKRKGVLSTMPIYQFVVVDGDHEYDPSVRWTHLPDEEAACDTVICLSENSNRADAIPIPLALASW